MSSRETLQNNNKHVGHQSVDVQVLDQDDMSPVDLMMQFRPDDKSGLEWKINQRKQELKANNASVIKTIIENNLINSSNVDEQV